MHLRHPRSLRFLALASVGFLAACGSDDDDGASFVVRTTSNAVTGTTPITVGGAWMVYLANENFSGATDLNGDTDTMDDVAVAVNMASTAETNLGVAAIAAAIVGTEVYLVVSEGDDGVDWNQDTVVGGFVLLHWSSAAAMVEFVDDLDPDSTMAEPTVTAGLRLYYASATPPTGSETTVRYLETAVDPLLPITVSNFDAATLRPTLLGHDSGLIFLALDETDEGVVLNGDGAMDDQFVLALLDGTDPAGVVKNVGVALADASAPFDARSTGLNDWLVALLVNEMAQGVNLNDQTLFSQQLNPVSCPTADADMDDDVLHYVRFADFLNDLPDSVVNTGLAGQDRVRAVTGFVATTTPEAAMADCDLNDDGTTDDVVARWVEAVTPVAPPIDTAQFHALATTVPGGSLGLSTLGNRFVIVVDEAADERNIDMKADDHDLVGWLDPAAGFTTTWTFSHSRGTPNFGTGLPGEPFAGAAWIAAESAGGRLGIAFQEDVPDINLNTNVNCGPVMKDADTVDSLPVWADFEVGPTLDFDGLGFALSETGGEVNAGIVLARGFAFFRVGENQDNFDWNADTDKNDAVLFRNPLTTCGPVAMATSTTLDGPVIVTDGVFAAAFLSSELGAGVDFNGDGDTTDVVVRYFAF